MPYGSVKFSTVDEYVASFPENVQVLLEELRLVIKQAAPQAVEVISYNMPAYKWHKVLVYFAAYKNHIGFYPTSSGILAFQTEIAKYKNAKGSVQFPLNAPLPFDLVARIVQHRCSEVATKNSNKKA